MDNAKHTGRVGALAVALGVGNVRRTATRMTVSIGAAALVTMATVVPVSASDEPPDTPCRDTHVTCALMMGGTGAPTPDDASIEIVRNQFIAPTHPGYIEYVKVTTPEELWPLTGVARLLALALGPPEVGGLGGPAWPDEPLWKLSGLFDLTFDQSVQAGAEDLEDAIAEHPNDHLLIAGISQGAVVANVVKRRLAEQYPDPTTAPDVDFLLLGDPNVPNGGLSARFPGLHVPILDFSLNGPEPTDTPFDTVVITRGYDAFADFPLYPLNLISLVNAVLGFVYVHMYPFDVSLAPDPSTSPSIRSQHGDTTYYFFPTQDLPLFGPLRTLGVPEPVIDVVEPFFRVLVELGYDRSIPAWEPTPARLIPPLDPASVAGDLVDAIGEGITNAAALIGGPPPLSIPAAPAIADPNAVEEQVLSAPGTALKRVGRDVGDHINNTIGAVKSVIGNGRTIARSAGSDNDSPTTTATRKTPLRDAVATARADVKKVVTHVSDNIKKALGGARDKANTTPERGAGATP